MDFLKTSTPIQNAIQLVQNSPAFHSILDLYSRLSRNEVVFLGAASLFTIYNLLSYIKARYQKKYNLPPMVPLGLPVFGHSLYLMTFPNKFIDYCNGKYGELYNLNLLGKTVTIASGKCAEEVLKADHDDLSLEQGILKDVLHLHYAFDKLTLHDIGMNVNPVVAKIAVPNSKMPFYVPGILNGAKLADEKHLNKDGPTIINSPSKFFQKYVAYLSVPTLLGPEVATNMEVTNSFAEFTGDITSNILVFLAVPKFLHPYILPYLQSLKKHHSVMEKHIAPIVLERRLKMEKAKEAGIEHNLEPNFLQGLIEYNGIDENGKPFCYDEIQLSHACLLLAFASVHTTSMNLSFALYWLLARPDLKERLLEEIKEVFPGETPITYEGLTKMQFLNNFIRESLRQSVDRLANGKKAMRDYTFYNGYQIPEGQTVESTLRQVSFGDHKTRATIEEMDPDMSRNKPSTTPAKDFVTFGLGKHLCPGRFFAVKEVELSLIYLLKNYDITTVSGKRPTPVRRIGGIIAMNSEEPLKFTPRKL